MPPYLLRGQFAALDPLDPDEPGAAIAAHRPLPEIVADILAQLARPTPPQTGRAPDR